jgi:hypothetical protein
MFQPGYTPSGAMRKPLYTAIYNYCHLKCVDPTYTAILPSQTKCNFSNIVGSPLA